jgi:hypothetical protein
MGIVSELNHNCRRKSVGKEKGEEQLSGRTKERSSGVAKEGGTKRPWGERSKEKGRDEGWSADAKEHFVEDAEERRC